ncbi:hypothetical protein BIT28_09330 [Photobacterium proteolyticum]|uniref:BIG2 domain-containing protein n=1 Tax=Photobacterium proteolyticum TaxID=1903952 RepID=A0A1Q9GIV2_9GAMM|nr:Ig-like domain-containing protein [Photobacterium proteolyticum]OLQ74365.1 hypothetical protein BIT28_09330 [Photobacterium proteolyticum]
MHKPILMSVSLIAMLTGCGGSDSDNKTELEKKAPQNTITFSGTVYDGPMADTTVSIYAGNSLLASGKTNTLGQYSVNASIPVAEFDKIKTQPITYHAQRNDIILYQFAGKSLAEAFESKRNQSLITNFSTVEYVLADVNKNNFVTEAEWNALQNIDRNITEKMVVRYGVGLKSIIDYSATLAGFDNSTIWLRALLDDTSWEEWYRLNIVPYGEAWAALFADTWFLDQEAGRFVDLAAWELKYDNVVIPAPTEPVEPVVNYLLMEGLPLKVSVGDTINPSVNALWSNAHSTNVTALANYVVTPEGALVQNGTQWEVKQAGTITLSAEYQGASTETTIEAGEPIAEVEHIVISGVDQQVTVGDILRPQVSAIWSDEHTTEVTGNTAWAVSPADAVVFTNGNMQVVKPGNILLQAQYQGKTATIGVNADNAVLVSLRLDAEKRQQYLEDERQVSAHGVHQNGYIVDFSQEAEWLSSNPAILESLGNGRFLGKAVGTATVTAKFGEYSATQEFDVEAKMVRVSLNLPNGTISRAETLQLSLNGEFNDGSVSVVTDGVVWSSSNPEFLTIDENGVATGIAEGQSVVSATYQDFTLEETVTVIQPKIISSTPAFVDGVMTLHEGETLEYGFKFVRSNGVEHVFTATENGLDFESYGFTGQVDTSGIKVGVIDKDADRIRAIRSGEDKLRIENVPVELQQIFVELGATTSANDYPSRVTLNAKILDNQDVYQWNALTGKAPVGETVTLVQAIQSNNSLYRFWQVQGAEQDGIYATQLTSEGESEAILVLADSELVSNQIISDNYDYVLLVTTDATGAEVSYRYQLSSGALTQIVMADFPNGKFNFTYDSFAFTPNGNLVVTHSDSGVTPYVYLFETAVWEQKAQIPGVRIQTPANTKQIAVLDTEQMNYSPFRAPVLSVLDLETLEVTSQEITYPGDAEYFCRSNETLSFAVSATLKDSGAGCLVSKTGSYDGVGYWLWDSIAELPKLHLFADGKVTATVESYAVASRKLDGHIVFNAGRLKDAARNEHVEVTEIADVEVEGVIEQHIRHQRLGKFGEKMKGQYSSNARLQDGMQFTLDNVDVPNELIAVFNYGTAVRNESGNWSSDPLMYQLPVAIDTHWKLYNLGNTLILSNEESTDPKYWQLQMRKPTVAEQPEEPVTPEEPVAPEEPVPPVEPEQPVDPAPAQ